MAGRRARRHGGEPEGRASSRRIGAVTLQSFSSGLPLGLVWIALPAFLTYRGVDIKTVGLFSLAQAPWSFKFLWSPLMDRYGPRFGSVGRRRSWILICQLFLTASILGLAARRSADVGMIAALALLIAFASASQDIVIDAYAVEVLERSEQGIAVGARTALARTAVLLSGAVTITLGQRLGWPPVFVVLALLFVPMIAVVAVVAGARRRLARRGRCARRSSIRCSTSSGARVRCRSCFSSSLQVRREPRDRAHPPVPDPEVLRPRGRGPRHRDDRPDGPDHRNVLRRRLDRADRTDALPLDLRLHPGRGFSRRTSRSTS